MFDLIVLLMDSCTSLEKKDPFPSLKTERQKTTNHISSPSFPPFPPLPFLTTKNKEHNLPRKSQPSTHLNPPLHACSLPHPPLTNQQPTIPPHLPTPPFLRAPRAILPTPPDKTTRHGTLARGNHPLVCGGEAVGVEVREEAAGGCDGSVGHGAECAGGG